MDYELEQILIDHKSPDFKKKIDQLSSHHSMAGFLSSNKDIETSVKNIVDRVAEKGDRALIEFSKKFDNVDLTPDQFRIPAEDLKAAHDSLDRKLLKALRNSIKNVKKYQSEIFIADKNTCPGIRYTPLKRVALCIPGASAPLPSTVIMTAVPAIVAGVEEIVVISPPRFNGSIHPVILGLCYELGIKEVYRLGGAHAVAAMAWGTETIKKVDKIVGPGNDYVQLAKKQVFGLVDMDSFAGPSDVIIIADDSANPAWIAADMLSQAEHFPGAAMLITASENLAHKTLAQLQAQLTELSRADQTFECLKKYSAIIILEDNAAVIDLANDFAAEHLEIHFGPLSEKVADDIKNAGAIFIGPYSPVATGDYYAGPSHTLPTRQTTKFFSPLSSNDFIKSSSIIKFEKQDLLDAADDIILLAKTEGLDAHAKSIQIRKNNQKLPGHV